MIHALKGKFFPFYIHSNKNNAADLPVAPLIIKIPQDYLGFTVPLTEKCQYCDIIACVENGL